MIHRLSNDKWRPVKEENAGNILLHHYFVEPINPEYLLSFFILHLESSVPSTFSVSLLLSSSQSGFFFLFLILSFCYFVPCYTSRTIILTLMRGGWYLFLTDLFPTALQLGIFQAKNVPQCREDKDGEILTWNQSICFSSPEHHVDTQSHSHSHTLSDTHTHIEFKRSLHSKSCIR